MMPAWTRFVDALGEAEGSKKLTMLVSAIGEPAAVSEDPNEYNDPLGKTRYYEFFKSGLGFGFRTGRLDHVHFYIQAYEGYKAYAGEIAGVECGWDEARVIKELGAPSSRGGGEPSMLTGYIYKWIKYEKDRYAVHFEFAQDGMLRQVSLMLR